MLAFTTRLLSNPVVMALAEMAADSPYTEDLSPMPEPLSPLHPNAIPMPNLIDICRWMYGESWMSEYHFLLSLTEANVLHFVFNKRRGDGYFTQETVIPHAGQVVITFPMTFE